MHKGTQCGLVDFIGYIVDTASRRIARIFVGGGGGGGGAYLNNRDQIINVLNDTLC